MKGEPGLAMLIESFVDFFMSDWCWFLGPEPSLVSIGEKGARFKSYFDCSIKSLTPENSIQIQRQLGADLVVVLGGVI